MCHFLARPSLRTDAGQGKVEPQALQINILLQQPEWGPRTPYKFPTPSSAHTLGTGEALREQLSDGEAMSHSQEFPLDER